MTPKRTATVAGVLLMLCAASAWIGPAGAQGVTTERPKTVVKLGVSGRPDQAFLELALERGYFEEQGITVVTVPALSGNEFVAPLATNQIQVASGSPNAGLFNALNRKIDIRIVGDFAHLGDANDGLVSIMVRSDRFDSGAITHPRDLKGKTISLGSGRGQYSYMMVNTILEMNKIAWSDVTAQHLAFADSIAGLSNKVLDASFMIEPLITAAINRKIARILIKGGEVESGAHLSVLVYSAEFAKQTDLATRFMVAYLRGVRDYHDAFFLKKDQDAAIEILTKRLSIKDPHIWRTAMPQHIDLNGRVNVADIKRQAAIYKRLGDVSGPVPDIDKYIDMRFAEGAVKLIGRR